MLGASGVLQAAGHFERLAPGSAARPAVERPVVSLVGVPGRKDPADAALQEAFKLITAERLRTHVTALSSPEFEGRGAGYPGEERAAAYIAGYFESIGLAPAVDKSAARAGHFQEFRFHPRRPPDPWAVLPTRNCAAFLRGSDPALASEIVVLGAHHDGQGKAGEADMGRLPAAGAPESGEYWPGGNDNGSGVAAVLQIAEAMVRAKVPIRRSVLFITFTGAEHGPAGSLCYAANPLFPWASRAGMIDLDMIGGKPGMEMNARATGTSTAWAGILARAAEITGTTVTMNTPRITNDADHYSFAVRGVPAIHFGIGGSRADHHRPSDTAGKVACDALAERCRFVAATLAVLADPPERPAFTARLDRDPGITGTDPTPGEFEARGVPDAQGGIKVNAVVEGLPAQKGGLRPGDLIVAVDGMPIGRRDRGMSLPIETVRALSAGRTMRLKVLRDGIELNRDLQF